MRARSAYILGISIIIAALIHAYFSGHSVGRYQMYREKDSTLLLDTKTGEVWEKFIHSNEGPSHWTERSGPWEATIGPWPILLAAAILVAAWYAIPIVNSPRPRPRKEPHD